MRIDINQFFDKPTEADWLKKAMTSLKLDDQDQFEKKLNFDSNEGVVLKSNYENENLELNLNSFPLNRRLARFTNKVDSSDLEEGVELFISKEVDSANKGSKIKTIVDSLSKQNESNWFNLFSYLLKPSKKLTFPKIDGAILLDLSFVHNSGGSIVHELSTLVALLDFVRKGSYKNKLIVKVSVDSLFFSNISKLRSIRHFCEFFQESFTLDRFEILSEPSIREMTIYDPWMNMLRQTSNLASAFLGGVDILGVHSYDYIYSKLNDKELSDLGIRQSRNQFHILKDESFLANVKDPSKGSYVVESLTREFIFQSFEMFKAYDNSGGLFENLNQFSREVINISDKRKEYLAKNKVSIAGVNSFSNTDERFVFNLHLEKKSLFPLRRTTEDFEKLRNLVIDREVKSIILVYGKESALSARIMFCSNYFEVLGHKIEIKFLKTSDMDLTVEADNIVICAKDDDYEELINQMGTKLSGQRFIAGNKFHKDGYQNIFAGQNIYEVLNKAVKGEFYE